MSGSALALSLILYFNEIYGVKIKLKSRQAKGVYMKHNEHFFNYYVIQTAITAVIIGLLAVDREAYSGLRLIFYGCLMGACIFFFMMTMAVEAYQMDSRKNRRSLHKKQKEHMNNVSKIA